jgi:hypothetical protein
VASQPSPPAIWKLYDSRLVGCLQELEQIFEDLSVLVSPTGLSHRIPQRETDIGGPGDLHRQRDVGSQANTHRADPGAFEF